MLSLSEIPSDVNETNKIDFPASYSDTVLLVGAMRKLSTIKITDWSTAKRLLKICRRFDFALVGSSIASQLGPLADQAPMRIFAIASQHDNVALARIALAAAPIGWYTQDNYVGNKFKLSELGDCTVPYLLALTECVYACGLMSERGNLRRKTPLGFMTDSMSDNWDSKVANFLPKVGSFLYAGPHLAAAYTIDHSVGD